MMLEMIMVPLFMNGSPWGPPRLIGAIGLGKEALPPPANFDFKVVMVAMIIHFVLAILFAMIIGLIVSKMSMGASIGVGIAAGLALYFVNFYGVTAIFPWFAKARNWVTIFTHLVYGLVAAWSFKYFYKEPAKAVIRN